jgi:hypothetical protein
MRTRVIFLVATLAIPLAAQTPPAAPAERSPLQTVELLHKAHRDADAATVDSLLHAEYHGVSLQGPRDHRHIYVETRAKAISDVAALKPNEWDVRILSSSTQVDPNGTAHVWARVMSSTSKGRRTIVVLNPIRCIKAQTDGRSSALQTRTIR